MDALVLAIITLTCWHYDHLVEQSAQIASLAMMMLGMAWWLVDHLPQFVQGARP